VRYLRYPTILVTGGDLCAGGRQVGSDELVVGFDPGRVARDLERYRRARYKST
jgi:hypothetical protein